MPRVSAKKVRDEGHWQAAIDGKVVQHFKHDTPGAAIEAARWILVGRFHLEPGEERLVDDIAKELGVPRRFIVAIPDFDGRDDYHLHVGDAVGGASWSRPKRDWTLFREDGSS